MTGEFPAQRASNAENVSIWWRHHVHGLAIHPNDYIRGSCFVVFCFAHVPVDFTHILRGYLTGNYSTLSISCGIFLLRNQKIRPIARLEGRAMGCILWFHSLDKVSTHWGRVTHISVSNLTIIGSDNGLSPGWCQVIIWTSAGILLTGPLGPNCSKILKFKFTEFHLGKSIWKCRLGNGVHFVSASMC